MKKTIPCHTCIYFKTSKPIKRVGFDQRDQGREQYTDRERFWCEASVIATELRPDEEFNETANEWVKYPDIKHCDGYQTVK